MKKIQKRSALVTIQFLASWHNFHFNTRKKIGREREREEEEMKREEEKGRDEQDWENIEETSWLGVLVKGMHR